jgi:predicted DNA-binding transcriptional regulator YafY
MAHPAARVLAVLELLQTHGRLTGPEMARRLGVDQRTLRRHLARLEEMGFPLTAERGRAGGYQLVSGFKLPPMMFTSDEALAVSVGLRAARELGMAAAGPAVESAQAKLARVLPEGLRRRLRAVDEAVTLDLHRASAPGDNRALVELSTAAQERRVVHLRYRSPRGDESARDFETYGLVFRGGHWYAAGLCRSREALRTFRLDRIVALEPRPQRFEPPAGFEALAHVTRSVASIPRAHAVEVLLEADLPAARRAVFGALGTLEPAPGGVLLRIQADDLSWVARELARLPFAFAVRSPAALRGELSRLAARLRRTAGRRAGSRGGRPGAPAPAG